MGLDSILCMRLQVLHLTIITEIKVLQSVWLIQLAIIGVLSLALAVALALQHTLERANPVYLLV